MTDINFGTVVICTTLTFSHLTPSSFVFVRIAEWLQNRHDGNWQ